MVSWDGFAALPMSAALCGSGLPDLPLMARIVSLAPASKTSWSSNLGLPAIPKLSSIPQAIFSKRVLGR
jgi:hypothetical protein